MPLLQKAPKTEQDAVQKLIRQIDGIDDEANQVGRYVLMVFAVVFTLAAGLLLVVILNPKL
ncbi:hypothetical protein [Bryobacter aggregatus]|uniref:hypothetical protein n=1 Tax=Bryobacter aggregatus TaxID=360054 RepID=UPI0004E1EF8B|nr:hypothetical protein [Bryobacter aggregatus]